MDQNDIKSPETSQGLLQSLLALTEELSESMLQCEKSIMGITEKVGTGRMVNACAESTEKMPTPSGLYIVKARLADLIKFSQEINKNADFCNKAL